MALIFHLFSPVNLPTAKLIPISSLVLDKRDILFQFYQTHMLWIPLLNETPDSLHFIHLPYSWPLPLL